MSSQAEPGTRRSLPGAGPYVVGGGGAGDPCNAPGADGWGAGGAGWLGGAGAGALGDDGVI
jgi:hypothetical protein